MPTKPSESEIENIHGMNQKQWRKWPRESKMAFNSVKSFMLKNRELTCHPDAAPMPEEHWQTIAHNAAFIAAETMCGKHWGKTGDKELDSISSEPEIVPTNEPAVLADA